MRAAPGSSRSEVLAIRSQRRKAPSFLFQCYSWLKMDLLTAHLNQWFMAFFFLTNYLFLSKGLKKKKKRKEKEKKEEKKKFFPHFIVLISRFCRLPVSALGGRNVRYMDRRRILQPTSGLHEQAFKSSSRPIYPNRTWTGSNTIRLSMPTVDACNAYITPGGCTKQAPPGIRVYPAAGS